MATLVFMCSVLFVALIAIPIAMNAFIAKYQPDHHRKMVEIDKAMKQKTVEIAKRTVGPALLKAAIRQLTK